MKAGLRAQLAAMLGPGVAVAVNDPRAHHDDLFPQERPAIAKAVAKRRREFAAGRHAARQAMGQLGLFPAAIPQNSDRSPAWPKGLIGSITHCDSLCIAVVSQKHRSLGIDAEPDSPLSDELIPMVCTEIEQEWLQQYPAQDQGAIAKQLFCVKEAYYKAQYPLTGKLLSFHAVQTLPITATGFKIISAAPMQGATPPTVQVARKHGFVLATCVMA